ncbi:Uncharacterized protein GBIM_14720, partial [Gryllus bimaculatus]
VALRAGLGPVRAQVRPILKNAADGLRSRDRSASPRPRLSFSADEGCDGSPPVALRRRPAPSPGHSPPQALGETPRRPLSVAERILTMESFLEQEAQAVAAAPTGAVPKRLGSLRAYRLAHKERFHTQPVTQDELLASARFNHIISPVEVEIQHKLEINGCDHETESLEGISGLSQRLTGISPPPRTDRVETKPETVPSPIDSAGNSRRSSLFEEVDSSVIRESCGSVSARASLFARLEEEMKQAAQEAKVPKKKDGSAVSRYKARREQMSNSTRFSTQPVTQEEVQEAWRQKEQNRASPDSSPDEPTQGVQGTMSARAAKDRMLEHGAQMLSRSNSLSQQHSFSESEPRRKAHMTTAI